MLIVCKQVTLKDDASPDDIQKCKDDIKAKGGEITHEYSLIKAFAYVPGPFSPPSGSTLLRCSSSFSAASPSFYPPSSPLVSTRCMDADDGRLSDTGRLALAGKDVGSLDRELWIWEDDRSDKTEC